MSGIRYVVTTELFWKTMAEYRRHGTYLHLRDKIDEVIFRKAQDRASRTSADKPFDSGGKLQNIWHAHLSIQLDAVLFYTMAGDELTLVALGNHGDYPHGGRHKHKAGPLAERIWNSVASGHVVSPQWQKLKWTDPKELIGHRDLREMDVRALAAIREDLRSELDTLSRFRAVTGLDAADDRNLASVIEYMEQVERADDAVAEASVAAEVSMKRHKTRMPCDELRR